MGSRLQKKISRRCGKVGKKEKGPATKKSSRKGSEVEKNGKAFANKTISPKSGKVGKRKKGNAAKKLPRKYFHPRTEMAPDKRKEKRREKVLEKNARRM